MYVAALVGRFIGHRWSTILGQNRRAGLVLYLMCRFDVGRKGRPNPTQNKVVPVGHGRTM